MIEQQESSYRSAMEMAAEELRIKTDLGFRKLIKKGVSFLFLQTRRLPLFSTYTGQVRTYS